MHTITIIERIVGVYLQLTGNRLNEWAGIGDIRAHLGDIPPEELTEAFTAMCRQPPVTVVTASGAPIGCRAHLAPESNRKTLTEADHATAVRYGGDENHIILLQAL